MEHSYKNIPELILSKFHSKTNIELVVYFHCLYTMLKMIPLQNLHKKSCVFYPFLQVPR